MIEKNAEYFTEKLVSKKLIQNEDKAVYQYGIEILISTAIMNNTFISNWDYYENSFIEYILSFYISDNSDSDRGLSCNITF